jgi:hypothetical protein
MKGRSVARGQDRHHHDQAMSMIKMDIPTLEAAAREG